MDRRFFLKTVLSSSLAVPLVAGLKPEAAASGDALYVISDAPQDVLPSLMIELAREGRAVGRTFSLTEAHPLAEKVGAALKSKGWRPAGPNEKPDVVLSFVPLRQACAPSFTFVRGGRVVDYRSGDLLSLWQDMSRAQAASASLTVAALSPKSGQLPRGERAVLYLDGRKKDRIDLNRELVRTYETASGFIRVSVEGACVRVADSSCRHKICASCAAVSGAGERIICAPNRFLVQVEGKSPVDAVIG